MHHRANNSARAPIFAAPVFPALLLVLWVWLNPSDAAAIEGPMLPSLTRLAQATPKLTGAVLLTELGCTACHATDHPSLAPKRGPNLSEVGLRAAGSSLVKFIEDPATTKPGTTMPEILGHLPPDERQPAASALVHYLFDQTRSTVHFTAPSSDAVDHGRKLYHTIGCAACHSPETPLPNSVPLGPLAEKYSVASLAAFLEDPLASRPDGRMPDLKLEPAEARDIASYLLRDQQATNPPFAVDPALARKGKGFFLTQRCGACHATAEKPATPAAKPLAELRADQGCLSGQPGPWPRYVLTEVQRDAIRATLATLAAPFTAAENVELTLTRLNCLGCHRRDDRGGVPENRQSLFTGRDENLGEQGRLPPPLTGVGAKLKGEWLREVLASGASVRPYLHTRMPRFGAANTVALAGWFQEVDQLPPPQIVRTTRAEKPHEIGRELAGSKGFNCIACHPFREKSAGQIRAVDLMTMSSRLQENWFHQYLASPQRFSPLTIMPNFWPDGVSPLPELLRGDPGKQRDALWQYLDLGPDAGEPRGLVLEPLVLTVTNEAVLLRRAYPGIGKRGIGVGYPSGINLSFDAGQLRLGSIWTGGFIEASSLWRGQGAGQAHILGRDTVHFPPGPAFAVLPHADTTWPTNATGFSDDLSFKGYTLDAQRRPTFRYQAGPVLVDDRFLDRRDDAGRPFLERTLGFSGGAVPAGWLLRVAADSQLEARDERTFTVGRALVIRLPSPGVVRDVEGRRELLLPVTGPVKLEYHPGSPR